MKLKIRKNPDPLLRQKTIKVKDPLAKDVQDLVLNMLETMRVSNGVGLAATQVGSDLRICVVQTEDVQYVLINPQITSKSKNKIISEEGCLSFPGKFFPISRHEEVQVRYLDEKGQPKKAKGRDLLARAFQHEIDHLDGILVIDRVKKNKKASVATEQSAETIKK
ncbi:MAG: hypothetical protein ACD_9C00091G0001 [uncultured bacterium]|nr:MAG: hypothetical protein ACD_9C00091G0001 [uncultured bacterium]